MFDTLTPQHFAGQPTDSGEPVFSAPWQARSFAMTLQLHQAGLFSWSEWADALSHNIAAHEEKGAVSSADDYYQLWQQTLEGFVQNLELAST